MRKFIQPVSMTVSSRMKYMEISQALNKMGYYCQPTPTGGYPWAIITDDLQDKPTLAYITPNAATWPKFHLIHQWNPEFFIAVAAMSSAGYWEGEWIVYRRELYKIRELQDGALGTKCICVIENEKGNNVVGLESVHKATIQELTAHFTQPTPKVEKEWEPVNGEECVAWDYSDKVYGKFIGFRSNGYAVLEDEDGDLLSRMNISKLHKITLTRSEAESRLSEIEGKTVLIKD